MSLDALGRTIAPEMIAAMLRSQEAVRQAEMHARTVPMYLLQNGSKKVMEDLLATLTKADAYYEKLFQDIRDVYPYHPG